MKNPVIENFLKSQQEFITNWAESPKKVWENNIYSKLKSVNKNIEPFLEYLPEPYLGNPYTSDGVFLNYNPGTVFKDDKRQHKDVGWFIKELNAIENYDNFANKVPYFNGENPFWSARKKFLSRILNKPLEATSLFGLEICPFHSSRFKLSIPDIKNLQTQEYIENNVLKIAEEVAKNSTLKTIISVGKDYCHLFELLKYKKVKEIDQTLKTENWPKKSKIDTKIKRSFSLWESPTGGLYFNTWAQGSNNMSSKEFDKIILENKILEVL